MQELLIRRLTAGDAELGRALFAVMASVSGEGGPAVQQGYAAALLGRDDVWVIAALDNDVPVGGLTAFVLPMTRSEAAEVLIYDLAVSETHQRRGIGRRLVQEARSLAAGRGIATTWVPAADEDLDALAFYNAIGGTAQPVTIFTFTR